MTRSRVVSVRLPEADHEALKAYAFFTGVSMNAVIVRAVRGHLGGDGRAEEVEANVERALARLRAGLDGMTDATT